MARPAPGVERTVTLITFLSRNPGRAFGLSELARQLDMNKATAHAMLVTLTDAGWLLRDSTDKSYRLGPALVAVGDAAAGPERQALDLSRPHLRRLHDEFGAQAMASTVAGGDIVVLAVEGDSPEPGGFGSRPGSRVPLTPPLGTAFIAWSDAESVERWLRRLSPRLDDHRLDLYRDAIRTIRRRGYTVALDEEHRQGLAQALNAFAENYGDSDVRQAVERVLAAMDAKEDYLVVDVDGIESHRLGLVSAPVFDSTGRACLTLTLSGFPGGLSAKDVDPCGRRLLQAAMEITRQIGGRSPDDAGAWRLTPTPDTSDA
ncbi:IclR family transcriptional regulator [Parafrankia elaeagni]|uniref:IclR family transcriptional regulator n=1 Tax=Parafrankia elaeagni TaxID=222534 RepID=UPI000368C791|nr:helix-turn-helix domain-containing protein [Parafrankia elaeagni]